VASGQFYIYSHPQALGNVQMRMEAIVQGNNPPDPFAARPELGEGLRQALRQVWGFKACGTAAHALPVKMTLKAVSQFMANSYMRGDRPGDHGAFGFHDVPNSASHGRGQIRLLSTHAFGMGAKMSHIVTQLPSDAHLVHDPIVRRPRVEGG